VISSLLPYIGRGAAVVEARLPSMGLLLAIVGILAGAYLGGRRLTLRDQFSCGFAGGCFGLVVAAVGFAIIRGLEPALGPWSSSLVAVSTLWGAFGAVMAFFIPREG
jgi:hypothetical protein